MNNKHKKKYRSELRAANHGHIKLTAPSTPQYNLDPNLLLQWAKLKHLANFTQQYWMNKMITNSQRYKLTEKQVTIVVDIVGDLTRKNSLNQSESSSQCPW